MTIDSKQIAIKFLSIHPDSRSQEDINAIYELTKHVEFFKKTLQDDGKIHRACCKLMIIEEFDSGDTIVSYGDIGDKFYIILSGELSVIVPVFTENHDQVDKEMKEVKILSDGDYFGELALIRGGLRAATVKARTSSLLVVLKKNDFKKILSAVTEKTINEKVEVLKKIPLFSPISHLELQKLSYYFSEVKFSKGQIVYKEKNHSETLYFIKSGEFKLTKSDFDQHDTSVHKMPSIRRNRIKNQSNKIKKPLDLQIVIKGENEYLGCDEMAERELYYKTTCTCISTFGVLYSISFIHFRQRIKNPDCWKIINDKLRIEKYNYNERLRHLRSVENLKEEFMLSKTRQSWFNNNHQSGELRKYSPMKDLMEINNFLTPNAKITGGCKNLVYRFRLGSLENPMQFSRKHSQSMAGSGDIIARSSICSPIYKRVI